MGEPTPTPEVLQGTEPKRRNTKGPCYNRLMFSALQVPPAVTVFGVLGEGVLPPVDLAQSIESVEQAITERIPVPAAVLTRSQSKRYADAAPQWLPDTFIAQVWCNRLAMTGLGSRNETVGTSNLGGFLPKLVHRENQRAGKLLLVDGTHLVPSIFDSRAQAWRVDRARNEVAAGRKTFRFGTLELALTYSDDGEVIIDTAPWPPVYVMEHVADDKGLIVVNSVNCGYLDFAVNFLRAARKVVNDVKVR